MAPASGKAAKADAQAQITALREQLAVKSQQATDDAATISGLHAQLAAARDELAQQHVATDDVVADLKREAQVSQQRKAARLLVLERLHRDLAAKYDASRDEVTRLQADVTAHKAAAAAAAQGHDRRMEELQRNMIAWLEQLAAMMQPKGQAQPES